MYNSLLYYNMLFRLTKGIVMRVHWCFLVFLIYFQAMLQAGQTPVLSFQTSLYDSHDTLTKVQQRLELQVIQTEFDNQQKLSSDSLDLSPLLCEAIEKIAQNWRSYIELKEFDQLAQKLKQLIAQRVACSLIEKEKEIASQPIRHHVDPRLSNVMVSTLDVEIDDTRLRCLEALDLMDVTITDILTKPNYLSLPDLRTID